MFVMVWNRSRRIVADGPSAKVMGQFVGKTTALDDQPRLLTGVGGFAYYLTEPDRQAGLFWPALVLRVAITRREPAR